MQFGRLKVIKRVENQNKHATWLCECGCEDKTQIIVRGSTLIAGRVKSCGCLYKERKRNKVPPNKFIFRDDYKVGLTDDNKEFYYDIQDADIVEQHSWYLDKDGYVITCINKKAVKMHKLLTNTDSNVFVDHKNNIKYDNRRNNLRICNTYQNAQNISIKSNNNSGVTGIGWHKSNNKWRVRIGVHNKSIYLGEYDNLEEAVKVRKEAEIKYFGEFAPQN